MGRLPYLNARPFHQDWPDEEPAWVVAAPRRLGEQAAAGALDAALLASRDALRLADRFTPLADLGIACRGAVGSVLLLSRPPPSALSGRRVALSRESSASRALARILLAERLGPPAPRFVEEPAPADARLVIGDAALELKDRDAWPHVVDLGLWWRQWTGLPFVYARWVVRRELPRECVRALAAALSHSLFRPLRLDGADLPARLAPWQARAYLSRFAYRLGRGEQAGLRRFRRELERHALL